MCKRGLYALCSAQFGTSRYLNRCIIKCNYLVSPEWEEVLCGLDIQWITVGSATICLAKMLDSPSMTDKCIQELTMLSDPVLRQQFNIIVFQDICNLDVWLQLAPAGIIVEEPN